MSRSAFPLVVLALALVLGCSTAHDHSHGKSETKPIARPGVLKGFHFGPASSSSGDEVTAQQVEAKYADALQQSIRKSGFKGTQSQLIARLKDDDDLVGAVLPAACLLPWRLLSGHVDQRKNQSNWKQQRPWDALTNISADVELQA